MSETLGSLRQKIVSAEDLQSVVRALKGQAAANIGQYERSAQAVAEYFRSVERGLGLCFRRDEPVVTTEEQKETAGASVIGAIVFGSDQGLVGQFNEVVADHAIKVLAELPGRHVVWVVGERAYARLAEAGLSLSGLFGVPNSVQVITPLVGRILVASETTHAWGEVAELHLFHNRPSLEAGYAPVDQRLLPLDLQWINELAAMPWPTRNLPETIGSNTTTLRALIREFLFVSLFRACAESLVSENASRLAAMRRAEKNIEELLEALGSIYHRLRQSGIDEELFDVISGFETVVAR